MDVTVDGRSWTADVGERVLVASGCLYRLVPQPEPIRPRFAGQRRMFTPS